MVLMSVDLPQPLGPRIAMCSSAPTRRLKSSRAIFWPRITRRLWKFSSGGVWADMFMTIAHLSVDEARRRSADGLRISYHGTLRRRLLAKSFGPRRLPRKADENAEKSART